MSDQPESGDTFTVYLDGRDLERGYVEDPSACPVAQALIDSGKVKRPRVGTVIRDLPRDVCLKVVEPEGLLERIDGGEHVEPGYVKVKVVEGYDSYEDAKAAHGGLKP